MTKIKRGDLVSTSGVGAVIRTQNGVFGVIGCLADWVRNLPVQAAPGQLEMERDHYLRGFEIRDPELEDACKVSRFVEPPQEPDDSGWNPPRAWEVPIFRFPITEYCSLWQCQRVDYSSPGDGNRHRCRHCQGARNPYRSQVPIFMVCRAGHLDEVPLASALPVNGCAHGELKVSFGASPTSPNVRCVSCSESGRLEGRQSCTGRRPWIYGSEDEFCSELMQIVERTSVNTYFPSTKSSIHIPLDSNIDERLISLLDRIPMRFFDRENPDNVESLRQDVKRGGFDVGTASVIEHLEEKERRDRRHRSTDPWDFVAARANEFEVLTGDKTYPALGRSRLLQFRLRRVADFDHRLIGQTKLITSITSVDVLTETRAIDGFSRLEPDAPVERDGFRLLWGFDRPKDSWLPAYRLHGEGIFLQLNQDLLPQGFADIQEEVGSLRASMTGAAVFAHSFAHLLMKALATSCGYQLPSIRDRIYELADGRVGLLVYTAEGDIIGTLGGLVALSEPGHLESLLDQVIEDARWCGQDPVCAEKIHNSARRVGAACHQCLLLPETSCERFNSDLDRRSLQVALQPLV